MTSRRETQKKKHGSGHNRKAYFLQTDEERDIWSAQLVNNTRDLTQAIEQVQKKCDVDTLTILTDNMMRVGIMLENKLAKMENTELTYYTHKDILSAAETYKDATFFLVEKLQTLFTSNGTLLLNHNNSNNSNNNNNNTIYTPALVWQWMAVASHALMAVLPEYYLALDNTNAHSEVLLLGLELLQQASNTSSLYTNYTLQKKKEKEKEKERKGGLRLVENCEHYGKDIRWMKFCTSSFNNHTSLEIRRAAILEELIALHPDYAPLRLHYTVTVALSPHVIKRDVARTLIEREQSKLHSRSYIDPLHSVMLKLCEAFVSPTQVMKRDVVEAIHKIESCAKLFRPFHHPNEDNWKRRFDGKQRPDVMNGEQAKRLLNVIKDLLEESGEVFPDALITCGE